ncbi:MAG TPA: hypothetical protein VKQ27_13540, partial [Acetobacteraceae bacterium]|nr:hypothetical protein [Acetobacteraceae bacterium]
IVRQRDRPEPDAYLNGYIDQQRVAIAAKFHSVRAYGRAMPHEAERNPPVRRYRKPGPRATRISQRGAGRDE